MSTVHITCCMSCPLLPATVQTRQVQGSTTLCTCTFSIVCSLMAGLGRNLSSQESALGLLYGRVKAKAPVDLRAPSSLQPHAVIHSRAERGSCKPPAHAASSSNRRGRHTSRMSLSTCAVRAVSSSAITGGASEHMHWQVTCVPTLGCRPRCTARSASHTPAGWHWRLRCHLHHRTKPFL